MMTTRSNAQELADNQSEKVTSKFNIVQSSYVKKAKYPGRMKIYLGGRITMSESNAWFSATIVIIVLIATFFVYLVVPNLIQYITIWPVVADFVLLTLSLSMAFTTAWTDPGIIPRNLNPRSTLRVIGATDYGVDDTISRLVFHNQTPDFLFGKEVIVNERRIFLKYCGTCEVFRPPRCSHCSFCDNCVEEFDHHCPWLSNCIGKRNYRFFILFLLLISTTCGFIAAQIGFLLNFRLQNSKLSFGDGLIEFWPIILLEIIIVIIGGLLSFMTVYHLVLILKDLTTNEQVKITRSDAQLNFTLRMDDTTCCRSFTRILCGPTYPRLVKWDKFINGPPKAYEEFV